MIGSRTFDVSKIIFELGKLIQMIAEPHNYRNGITCMHRNRNPCNSFLVVNMERGRVRPTTASRNMVVLLGLIPSFAASVLNVYL